MEAYFPCSDEETALQRCSFLCEPLHQAAEVTVCPLDGVRVSAL